MKHIACLLTVALGLFITPGLGWLVPVVWWAALGVAGTVLTTATGFFTLRWLKRHFPEQPVPTSDRRPGRPASVSHLIGSDQEAELRWTQ